LNTDYIGDCSPGQKLWLNPATTNTPASYTCYTIPPTPCTGTDVLYYDLTNMVYACYAVADINTICSNLGMVDFKYSQSSLTLYSCYLETDLPSLCTGVNLIFFDTTTSVY
jgi:hypothetical protein